jgi:hypothetical protein
MSHRFSSSLFLLGAGALGFLSACSDSATIVNPGEEPAGMAGGGNGLGPTNSAVMLVGQVYAFEGYNTYVGIFPEVPDGEVDFRSFREFGNANVYTKAGYVFVEEDGTVQRFSVNERLELVDGPRFSWLDFGVASINASYTVFVSEQRSYTFAPELGVVIVWNPDTMTLTGTLPLEMPERPAGMETFAYDGYVVGDKVFWNVFSGDWDEITPYTAVTVAIADAERDEPVRFIEDDRCIPGGPSYVDDNGDYYLQAGAFFGYFFAYGDVEPNARTCALRIRRGQEQFDPDYLVDYQQLTGSYVNDAWFYIAGSQYFARAWDPAVAFPEDSEQFYENAALRPLLLDTATVTASPYPDLIGAKAVDGVTRVVDGVSYYQLSQTGYVENGNTDVVELHPEGIVPRFHLPGFLLGLERVR